MNSSPVCTGRIYLFLLQPDLIISTGTSVNFLAVFLWGGGGVCVKGVVFCVCAGILASGLSLWAVKAGGSWPASMRDLTVRHD